MNKLIKGLKKILKRLQRVWMLSILAVLIVGCSPSIPGTPDQQARAYKDFMASFENLGRGILKIGDASMIAAKAYERQVDNG